MLPHSSVLSYVLETCLTITITFTITLTLHAKPLHKKQTSEFKSKSKNMTFYTNTETLVLSFKNIWSP